MRIADYFSQILFLNGVTDVFGVPGGVILKLLNAFIESEKITPHLNYHEQMAGFAACGYAQSSGRLGVAYATRGPGISNMFTCIAEAYQESIPVLFITAHGNRENFDVRFSNNQEMDIVSCVKTITKYAVEINNVDDAVLFEKACKIALGGRKGPVLIDIASSLLDKDIFTSGYYGHEEKMFTYPSADIDAVLSVIASAQRPVILIGDGLRYCKKEALKRCLERINIPVISSRGSQDIFDDSKLYFGYVGSHGTRYSNFILSKSDLIIAVGNRLAFPFSSASYAAIIENKKIIRVDIDNKEFSRSILGSIEINMDGKTFFTALSDKAEKNGLKYDKWINVCNEIFMALKKIDLPEPVIKLAEAIKKLSCFEEGMVVVSDVGNNEFWVSRALEYMRPKGLTLLCSKSFGTLGNALGKAIGSYFALHRPVICIMGDQGFQFNVQELQFISRYQIPIAVIVMNNNCSGMISDHEEKIFKSRKFLVDDSNGYSAPDVRKIAVAYDIEYHNSVTSLENLQSGPIIYEVNYPSDISLVPFLPVGSPCQDMMPLLAREYYKVLNDL